jgi:RHS repeat-associated protein
VFNNSQDFKDYTKGAGIEYVYNANGSMIKDLNKGISAMTYNILNLPRQMDIKSPVAEARNDYIYSAGGQKLKVIQQWNPSYSTTPETGSAINTGALTLTKTTDYVGNKIYENDTLKLILTDNGYFDCLENKYYFYIRDHLGNNRVVTDQRSTIIQSTQYYPFGMAMGISLGQTKQPYKFGGKELDMAFGLNMYDYVARGIDMSNPVFTTIDPLAEKYPWMSPYTFLSNNPMNRIDPDGRRDRRVGPNEIIGTEHLGSEIGGTTASVVRTASSTRVVGKSNEHYGNQKKSPTSVNLNISGEMRESNNLIADVQVSAVADFADGESSTAISYDAIAGGYGNGSPENGEYTVNNYRDRSSSGSYNKGMNKDGVGFSLDLNPQFKTGRTELRIHPDGNNEGTLGCIGLSGNSMILKDFVNLLKSILQVQPTIPTNINIINNPNNDGRDKEKLPNVNE